MATVMTEMKRMMPMMGDGERASANTYFAMTGMMGMMVWGFTAVVYHFVTAQVSVPFSADAPLVLGWAGIVTLVWLGIFTKRIVMARMSVRPRVQFSGPGIVWITTMATAFVLNVVGLFIASEALMWLPWAGGFAIAYTLTGLMVQRGGIFLMAGVASAGMTVYGLFLGTAASLGAPFVLLGMLHSMPMIVDAARGGRQLTDEGIPQLKADQRDGSGETTGAEITA